MMQTGKPFAAPAMPVNLSDQSSPLRELYAIAVKLDFVEPLRASGGMVTSKGCWGSMKVGGAV